MSRVGMQHEAYNQQRDVQLLVNEYGKNIKICLRKESAVTRDRYNSIITRSNADEVVYEFRCFPYDTSPTTKQLERAGITEQVDSIAWLAVLDFEEKGIDYGNLMVDNAVESIRSTVIVDDATYTIKQKNMSFSFGDVFGYIVLGLSKR